jgi:hypothetical protein
MEVSTALRRVKRDFGDEYNVVIIDQDIYDWFYDAELDIIRSTSDNDLTLLVPANKFPLQVPDRVQIKRLSVSGKALTYTTITELDLNAISTTSVGTSNFWYFQGGTLSLWPASHASDDYIVEVAYVKTPAHMTVVSPFLQWGLNPSALQYGKVDSADDWKMQKSVNLTLTLCFTSITEQFVILTCGQAPISAPSLHFELDVQPSVVGGPLILKFYVSDSVVMKEHTLTFLTPIKVNEIFTMQIVYDSATSTATLHKTDSTGTDILQSTSTLTPAPFHKNTLSLANIYLGVDNDVAPPIMPNYSSPLMKIFGMILREGITPDSTPSFVFDGETDLGELITVAPNFTTTSGHTMKTAGNIVTAKSNVFTVPEVFHEDVVKYALAKAHDKNMNFRASELAMEQYDRRVSTRRHESQTIDGPIYKIVDPYDYEIDNVVY